MRREQILYFFDFFLCPPLAAYLASAAFAEGGEAGLLRVVSGCIAGLVLWTFIEYWVHRGLFHHAPGLRQLHAEHHATPHSLAGSPPALLPLALILLGYAVFSPIGSQIRYAACAGLLVGYLIYSFVHYATHHIATPKSRYLKWVRRGHLQHHFRAGEYNFGVTSNVWDHVFSTAMPVGSSPAHRREK